MKKVYPGLDLAKFLCAILILVYHCGSDFGSGFPGLLDEALSLYAVALPVFVVISSFLFYEKLKRTPEAGHRDALWHTIKRILIIYGFWSIGFCIFQVACWLSGSTPKAGVGMTLYYWITRSTYFTIWFLPTLAIGIALSYFFIKKFSFKVSFVLSFVMYLFGSLISTWNGLIRDFSWTPEFMQFIKTWIFESRCGFFYGFVFVNVGYLLSKNKDVISFSKSVILSMVFTGAVVAEGLCIRMLYGNAGVDMVLFMIPASYFITAFFMKLSVPNTPKLVIMRRMSVLIFVSQRYFITVIPFLLTSVVGLSAITSNTYLGTLVFGGGTIVFSFLFVYFSQKYNFLKNVY